MDAKLNLSYQDYKVTKADSFNGCPTMLTSEKAALAKAHPELRVGPTGQTYKEAWKQRHRKKK